MHLVPLRTAPQRALRSLSRRLGLRRLKRTRLGPALDDASRLRLIGLGLDGEELDEQLFREAACDYPPGWRSCGNRLYVGAGVEVNRDLITGSGLSSVSGFLIVLASPIDNLAVVLCDGVGGTLYIGSQCWLPGVQISCGQGSSIVLRSMVTCTWAGQLDARNGGSIFAERDQVWATGVYIATDDMHALRDRETGERLNPRGCTIRIGEHVWLGLQAVVTGNSEVGSNSVVGMRSVVRNAVVPSDVAVAGTPARVIRTGVVWTRSDFP